MRTHPRNSWSRLGLGLCSPSSRVNVLAYRRLAMQLTAGVLSFFSFADPGCAQACQLNGKTLEIAGLSCLPQKCSTIRQNITVLGDKVLLSFGNNMWGQTGEMGRGRVYYLGRTINPDNDPLNPTWIPEPNEVATLFAEMRGDKLSLVERRTQSLRPGQTDSDYWFKIGIRLVGCASCEVYQYEHSGHAKGIPAVSTWRPYYCKMLN